ncbi:MAG: homoserine dehydrogenase, partial [Pseudomonadota bacterium]
VGCGVFKMLEANAELITARAGRSIEVVAVSARDRTRDRGIDLRGVAWHDDARSMTGDPAIDLVCELIGGEAGIAYELIEGALRQGKAVVTANKALLAHHGANLASLAEAHEGALFYEAAVAGGIPIVKSLREGLAGNRITRIAGILNGTCNYILTTMRETGRAFDDVLSEAQTLGYAEADPSFDVDGVDAAHKLALLASLAFGGKPQFDAIHVEGIRYVTPVDFAFAEEFGYRIKLIATARMLANGLEQRVHPAMVKQEAPLGQVEGVFNAVVTEGDFVDVAMQEGRGAGEGPTASAVVADIMDFARGLRMPVFGIPSASLADHALVPMAAHRGRYYCRLLVVDKPGVLADITAVFRDQVVSIEGLVQRARNPGQPVPIVLTSHDTEEAGMVAALTRIETLDAVVEKPCMIRIEPF